MPSYNILWHIAPLICVFVVSFSKLVKKLSTYRQFVTVMCLDVIMHKSDLLALFRITILKMVIEYFHLILVVFQLGMSGLFAGFEACACHVDEIMALVRMACFSLVNRMKWCPVFERRYWSWGRDMRTSSWIEFGSMFYLSHYSTVCNIVLYSAVL